MKTKIIAVLTSVFVFWLVCPLPEISILGSLIFGSTLKGVLPIPWWSVLVFAPIGGVVGSYLVKKLDLLKNLKGGDRC